MAFSPFKFLQEVRSETAKVTWPTREEALRLTYVVIGIAVALGLVLGLIDTLLTAIYGLLVRS